MSCRTPGGVVDAEGYWSLLSEGRDVIGPFPERWDIAALYDPDPDVRGKSYAREGGFLRDVVNLTRVFLVSRRGKRCRWIRSSGWCWKWRGRRWSGSGSELGR